MFLVDQFPTFLRSASGYFWKKLAHRHRSLDNWKGEEDVTGKIVIITGANGGLGKATAFQLARRGAVIIMACRDVHKGLRVAREIQSKVSGAQLVWLTCLVCEDKRFKIQSQ